MAMLSKIWNYRPDPERYGSLRNRALRGLAFFLGLMLCFTLISRAADSLTVASVSTASTSRTGLMHSYKVDGEVEAVGSVPVMAPSGVMVQRVPVAQGDTVAAGDLVLVYDPTELRQKLSTSRLELEKLQLELEDIGFERERDLEEAELKAARAEEDYEQAVRSAEAKVNAAVDEREAARKALRSYDGEDDDVEASLRTAYRNARRQVEQAILDQTETLLTYQRAIDDAEPAEGSELRTRSLSIDIQIKQMEITWLQQSMDDSGMVYAPADGVVGEVSAAAGRYTTGEAVLYLTDTDTLRAVAEIDADQRGLLGKGASIALTDADNNRTTGLTASSLLPVEGSTERYKLAIELPEDSGLSPYQAVTLEIGMRSQTYDSCVPLGALYQEGQNSYYLLRLADTETVVGTQTVVERVDVTLLDRNDSYAAVSGAVGGSDRLVTASSRPLSPGDRVRLEA